MIIEGVRAKGFQVVPLYQLLGKTRTDVMPTHSIERTLGGPFELDWILAIRRQHQGPHLDFPDRRLAHDRPPVVS